MKSKLFYFLLIPLFLGIFQSCGGKKEDAYAEWKKENEAHIEKIRSNPAYSVATVPGGPGAIYYKALETPENGNGISPFYTSKVVVSYKGSLINETVFDDASNRTVEFYVNGVVQGFGIALQNMQVGDKWEIHIPWRLGYGATTTGSIPPYSALIFELELIEISQY